MRHQRGLSPYQLAQELRFIAARIEAKGKLEGTMRYDVGQDAGERVKGAVRFGFEGRGQSLRIYVEKQQGGAA